MKNTLIRIFALMMALCMIACCVGCGGDDEEVEIIYQYEDEVVSSDGSASTDNDATTSSTDTTSSTTSSSKKPNSKAESVINDNVKPADYKGTTITYATWRDPSLYEDGPVVKAFEKKYGIKVKIELTTETEYTTKVYSKIVSKQAPDVYFSTYTFPYCLDVLQPIDAAKLNLNESIWDKALIETATVNGKTYLVDTVGNIWKDQDMVFYNKKIFKQNNIKSPEDYVKADNWTFETMAKCMQDVARLGSDYIGGAVHLEGLIHSAGASVIGLQNGKFVNGTKNSVTQDIMRWASTGLKEGWLGTASIYAGLEQFPSGKVGVAVLHSFGLKKTGYLRNMKADDIGFVNLPSWKGNPVKATSFVRGWGICREAKNPVAAGIFLRHYLDVNNYNTTSAFISKDAENFFFKLNATNTKDKSFYFCYGSGVNGVVGRKTDGPDSAVSTFILKPANSDPSQVLKEVEAYQGALDADIVKLNAKLK